MPGSDPLDENFFYNSMLAKALVQLIPPNERKMIRIWFDKLLGLGKNSVEKEMRNEFMWFILLMLQCQKIREPFNGMPPVDMLPLKQLVPTKVYEEILIANDDNMAWLEPSAEKKVQFKQSAPSNFFHNQPLPNEGGGTWGCFNDTGSWKKLLIRNKRGISKEFEFKPLYTVRLDIPQGKIGNLKDLTPYLKKAEAKNFNDNLFATCGQFAQISDVGEDDNSGMTDED